jgi:formamidopyrimidine-DNA glycosylase
VVRTAAASYNRNGPEANEETVPELPEVETVVRDLRPRLVGRRIVFVRASRKALRKPWSAQWRPLLLGQPVHDVWRRGKWIIVDLASERSLVFHLGMTGRLTVTGNGEKRAAHTHLVFKLDDDRELRFNDIRRFGSAVLLEGADAVQRFFEAARLGPEPAELDSARWRERLAATQRCLKAVLLDQTVVAGVGNIYADESLFEARLHPARQASTISAAEAARLRKAVVAVLSRAIHKRGSSIRNYVGGSGLKGSYQDEFRVYGRMGQPCPRCGAPIERTRLAGRSTHYCPRCQQNHV